MAGEVQPGLDSASKRVRVVCMCVCVCGPVHCIRVSCELSVCVCIPAHSSSACHRSIMRPGGDDKSVIATIFPPPYGPPLPADVRRRYHIRGVPLRARENHPRAPEDADARHPRRKNKFCLPLFFFFTNLCTYTLCTRV